MSRHIAARRGLARRAILGALIDLGAVVGINVLHRSTSDFPPVSGAWGHVGEVTRLLDRA